MRYTTDRCGNVLVDHGMGPVETYQRRSTALGAQVRQVLAPMVGTTGTVVRRMIDSEALEFDLAVVRLLQPPWHRHSDVYQPLTSYRAGGGPGQAAEMKRFVDAMARFFTRAAPGRPSRFRTAPGPSLGQVRLPPVPQGVTLRQDPRIQLVRSAQGLLYTHDAVPPPWTEPALQEAFRMARSIGGPTPGNAAAIKAIIDRITAFNVDWYRRHPAPNYFQTPTRATKPPPPRPMGNPVGGLGDHGCPQGSPALGIDLVGGSAPDVVRGFFPWNPPTDFMSAVYELVVPTWRRLHIKQAHLWANPFRTGGGPGQAAAMKAYVDALARAATSPAPGRPPRHPYTAGAVAARTLPSLGQVRLPIRPEEIALEQARQDPRIRLVLSAQELLWYLPEGVHIGRDIGKVLLQDWQSLAREPAIQEAFRMARSIRGATPANAPAIKAIIDHLARFNADWYRRHHKQRLFEAPVTQTAPPPAHPLRGC